MLNENKWFHVYQEEAGEGAGSSGGDSLLDGASGGESGDVSGEGASDWFYADGVQGEGDRPDFLMDKYSSMAEQAKAYPELAKKMGAHTGSPEEYDLAQPDGTNELFELNMESEGLKNFLTSAKEGGISQEFMSQAMEFHLEAMQDALGDLVPNKEAEIESLGKDAPSRINNVEDWCRANLDDEA